MQFTWPYRDKEEFPCVSFSTKIHKVDQSIYRNKSNFIAKQEEGEYSEKKKLMYLHLRDYNI